jgi:hypothetical protein
MALADNIDNIRWQTQALVLPVCTVGLVASWPCQVVWLKALWMCLDKFASCRSQMCHVLCYDMLFVPSL